MEQILLSISMLASNRIDTIRRTLDSLKPIMEQIPSELILVDTSTDPEVSSLLTEYTNHIVKFKWVNDFSAARNAGLAQAKGEWFLYIDDDEWFVEVDELVRFFKSGEYKEYGMANYIQRNFHDPEWLHYSDVWVSRIIRRDKDTRFRSKIHEYLYPVRGKCKMLKLIANHTGYIAVTEEDRMKRFYRNSVLLLEMIEEEPMRLRWRVQLAQEYWSVQKWEELLEFCLDNIEYTKDRTDEDDSRDIGTFYGGAMEALVYLKRYEEAKELGIKAIQDYRMNELCQAYIRLRFAEIAMKEKQWTEAESQAKAYFAIGEELKKNEQEYGNQKGALIIDETFESVSDKKAYSIRIACGLKNKDTSILKRYLDKLEWNQKVIYVFSDLIPVLIEAMSVLPYEDVFVETLQYLWNNQELQKELCIQISELEVKKPERFKNLELILTQIEGDYWYLWYTRKRLGKTDSSEILSIETWEKQIQEYLSIISMEELLLRKEQVEALRKKEGIYFEIFEIRIAQEEVLRNSKKQDNCEKDLVYKKYVERVTSFIEKHYNQEIILNYPELLPDYGQMVYGKRKD